MSEEESFVAAPALPSHILELCTRIVELSQGLTTCGIETSMAPPQTAIGVQRSLTAMASLAKDADARVADFMRTISSPTKRSQS